MTEKNALNKWTGREPTSSSKHLNLTEGCKTNGCVLSTNDYMDSSSRILTYLHRGGLLAQEMHEQQSPSDQPPQGMDPGKRHKGKRDHYVPVLKGMMFSPRPQHHCTSNEKSLNSSKLDFPQRYHRLRVFKKWRFPHNHLLVPQNVPTQRSIWNVVIK